MQPPSRYQTLPEVTTFRWLWWQTSGMLIGALLLFLILWEIVFYATQPILPTTPLCGEQQQNVQNVFRTSLGVPNGYASCAIVGSAGFLRLQRLGREIDAHDFVIRANLAPVGGYEEIVGARTSMRILNSEAAGAILLEKSCSPSPQTRASICPRYSLYLNSGDAWLIYKFKRLCPNTTIFDETDLDSFDPAMRAQWQGLGTNLMSGSWAIGIAMKLCNSTTIYGVSHEMTFRFNQNPNATYHYFDERKMSAYDSLPTSAKALTKLASMQRSCIKLHAETAKTALTKAHPGMGDALVDDVNHTLPRSSYIGRVKVCEYGLQRSYR